jgi:hypothetical protein
MQPRSIFFALFTGACALAQAASAQTLNFNLDVGSGPVPSTTYGAAASQPGQWMQVNAATPFVSIPLTNVYGGATSATLNYNSGFDFSYDNPQTQGDDAALFDDTQGVFAVSHWQFANLRPGEYDVWSYAWAPDSPLYFLTRVAVTGSLDPQQVVGGHDWNGTFVQGWHYAKHRVTVSSAGTLEIVFSLASGACTINGVQLRELNPPPETYCSAGTSTYGCQASISSSGVPSASAPSGFFLAASGVEGQRMGLLLYGASGRAATPWGTGSSVLCLQAPLQRTPAVSSGGTSGTCNGALLFDWNAYMTTHPGALGNPRQIGQVFQAQFLYRDPPASMASTLSNALEFTLSP